MFLACWFCVFFNCVLQSFTSFQIFHAFGFRVCFLNFVAFRSTFTDWSRMCSALLDKATIGYIVPEYFKWPGFFVPFYGLEVFRCAQWIGCHRQGPWKRLGSDCCLRRLLWALRLQIQWSARWVWLEGNLFYWSRSAQAKAQRRTCQWKISFSKFNSLAVHFAFF